MKTSNIILTLVSMMLAVCLQGYLAYIFLSIGDLDTGFLCVMLTAITLFCLVGTISVLQRNKNKKSQIDENLKATIIHDPTLWRYGKEEETTKKVVK